MLEVHFYRIEFLQNLNMRFQLLKNMHKRSCMYWNLCMRFYIQRQLLILSVYRTWEKRIRSTVEENPAFRNFDLEEDMKEVPESREPVPLPKKHTRSSRFRGNCRPGSRLNGTSISPLCHLCIRRFL